MMNENDENESNLETILLMCTVVRYLPLVCPSSSISLIWLSSCLRPLSII